MPKLILCYFRTGKNFNSDVTNVTVGGMATVLSSQILSTKFEVQTADWYHQYRHMKKIWTCL